jgi:type II secretory pathway component PulJ
MRLTQRNKTGFSLFGLLVTVLIIVAVIVPVLKSIPSLFEYQAVSRAAIYAKQQGATAKDAVAAFDKQAQIDRITAIRGQDLDIKENDDGTVQAVNFAYRTEVPLYGPLTLVIAYSGSQH